MNQSTDITKTFQDLNQKVRELDALTETLKQQCNNQNSDLKRKLQECDSKINELTSEKTTLNQKVCIFKTKISTK